MDLDLIKDLGIDELLDDSIIETIDKALGIFQEVQKKISAFNALEDTNKEKVIKTGTAISHEIFIKMLQGKLPVSFNNEDWADVLKNAADIAFDPDEQKYSLFVFKFYAEYLSFSTLVLASKLSENKKNAIFALIDELEDKGLRFQEGEIKEADYIADSLWICLEALVKLMSGTIDAALGLEKERVSEAAMTFAFEYVRLSLYRKEQALLTEYLRNQKALDTELALEYEKYKKELDERTSQFAELIDNAFSPDMRNALRNSVQLARAAGISEEEILKNEEEIDDYFS